MFSFKEFRKEIGFSCEELEKITGYSRQGLDCAFKNLNKNVNSNAKFLTCIDMAISQQIENEMQKFTKRVDELKAIQEKFKQFKEE